MGGSSACVGEGGLTTTFIISGEVERKGHPWGGADCLVLLCSCWFSAPLVWLMDVWNASEFCFKDPSLRL